MRNLARRPRQRLGDPGYQFVLLLVAQTAGAALVAKARQTIDPVLFIQPIPGPDRIAVEQQSFGDCLPTHPGDQQNKRVRTPAQTMSGRPVAGQLDQALASFTVQEAPSDHRGSRIPSEPLGKGSFGFPESRGIQSVSGEFKSRGSKSASSTFEMESALS